MDMKLTSKGGKTNLELHDNLWNKLKKHKFNKISCLYNVTNDKGQALLIAKFDNGTLWMPKWDDELTFLWAYAFLTELENLLFLEPNKKRPRTYNPQKNLIEPLIDFVNREIGAWELKLAKSPLAEAVKEALLKK